MRVGLDLPDWADERNIYLMAGLEVVARLHKDGEWEVKTRRCNMCGECCSNLREPFIFPLIEGRCTYLKKEVGDNSRWLCALGEHRPFSCSICTPANEHCTIKYEAL